MAKHINEQNGEIKEMFTAYSFLLTIKEHSVQLNRANECQKEYEIFIYAGVSSQKGAIQLQLITPAQILEEVKITQAKMPSNISLPIPTSATYHHLLLRIISIDVFFKGHFLVHMIRLPLTMCFTICIILQLPNKIKGTDSKFIQPEHDYLLMDTAKRYFTMLGVDGINECKTVRFLQYVNRLSQCS